MPGPRATSNSLSAPTVPFDRFRRTLVLAVGILLCFSLCGCQWFRPSSRGSGFLGGGWPWRLQAPCTLPPDISTADLIKHLNANVERTRAWRSDAQVRIQGTAAILNAEIAVESPKNFRMVITSGLTGQEADLGSNADRLWFWMRRSQPELIFTARHDQLDQLRGRAPLPFQPAWLMEVLGVVPIDPHSITDRQPVEGQRLVKLISQQTALDGQPVTRQIVVDTCHGHIVAHELFDASHQLIARATLGDYRPETRGGVAVPHRLDLKWPSAQMAMSMNLRRVEVNPEAMPARLWQIPEKRNSTPYDIVLQQPLDRAALAPAAAPVLNEPPLVTARTPSQPSPSSKSEQPPVDEWARQPPETPASLETELTSPFQEDPAFAPREPRPPWAGGE